LGIQEKDARTLKKAIENKKWAKKAYSIQMAIDPRKETSQEVVLYRNMEIQIVMKEDRKDKYWKEYYKRSKPQPR
jgi:hypothetical protein